MRDGSARRVSLRGVFAEGHDIADLAVRPHERIALMRLLICIAQAALKGPADHEEWQESLEHLPAAADRYLAEQMGAFNLFDPERPFLQIAGLKKEDATAASKLNFALATGNNSTLFDNSGAGEPRAFEPARLALMLLAFQCFSVGGTIGTARWGGRLTLGGSESGPGNSGHAPCTPSSMLHAFVRRHDLLATTHANLLAKSAVGDSYKREWGYPVWERPPASLGDTPAIQNATQTYLGRLVPLARAVLLRPDRRELLLANGLDYPSFPEFAAEPSATIVRRRDKEEHYPLGASTKAIWRLLPALVVRRKAGLAGGALTLANLDDARPFDLWVGALVSDKASILDTTEGVLHVPPQMLTDVSRAEYEEEVEIAERKASTLGAAIVKWRELADGAWPGKVKSDPKARAKLQAAAARHYWMAVERSLSHLHACIDGEGEAREAARSAWRQTLRAAALAAYEMACSRATPRQMRAFALVRAQLTRIPKPTAEPTA